MRAAEIKASRQLVLRLNSQNEFHISIFSDLHYGEEEYGWGIDQDINSTRVINSILDDENPDFVIISTFTLFLLYLNHVSDNLQTAISSLEKIPSS
jgi:hypothetical protein